MRFWLILLLLNTGMALAPVGADEGKKDKPAAVPEPPALPRNYYPETAQDRPEDLAPEITIVPKGATVHEEYRLDGQLYMVKVIPAKGPPYYLVDREGHGEFVRSEFEPQIAIPMWVIKRF